MVDATAGHEMFTFTDAFSRYNQILMHPDDQEKTVFIMERGTYCYKVMPFGLRNVGATYQRLVKNIFEKLLGDTMEVYIEDMLVKSETASDHISHLQQAFEPNIQHEVAQEVNMISDDNCPPTWTLLTSGSSNIRGTGLRLMLKSQQGDMIVQSICCAFKATNNEEEYEALILGLTLAHDMHIRRLEVRCDSLLIISQINGSYAAKESKMQAYLEIAKSLVRKFDSCNLQQIPRDQNSQADTLANLCSNINPTKLTTVRIVHLIHPATTKETFPIREQPSTSQTPTPTSWFILIPNVLFRDSVARPYLRCLDHDEIETKLRNIHDEECERFNRLWKKVLFKPAFCVYISPNLRSAQSHPIPLALHEVGDGYSGLVTSSFKTTRIHVGNDRLFLLVVEAEAFKQVRDTEFISFSKRNVLRRCGNPSEIVYDNGCQFISNKTTKFCARYNITLHTSTPRYPQVNGQAESSNKIIINNLKKRLDDAKGKCAHELSMILWSDRTTPETTTNHTPFSLVFVIPLEVEIPTTRYGLMTAERNNSVLAHGIDTVDGLREATRVRMASHHPNVARSYNKKVRVKASNKEIGCYKMSSPIRKICGAGSWHQLGKVRVML
ncbi:uncharacterized protein [Spinacia oleracea]|uniref:Integrase catalytic domain-containing protein n=1 Tax=Spinacia oleracea TaxID=3562 RepID=A0ABM3RIJ9_SPIOL|nr:uncharacterized protein LOC130469932 [Spinacia oleracea]